MRRAIAGRIERFDAVLIGTVLALACVTTGSIGVPACVGYQERRKAFALFESAGGR
jgi:hypothetical protein